MGTINSLNRLEDKYAKDLFENRATYIDSGEATLKSTSTKINKIISKLLVEKEQVYVREKNMLDNSTIISLSSNSLNLPPYYPGQYIIVSTYVRGNYYSRPYYLISTKDEINEGIYKINVLNNDDSIFATYLRNIKVNNTVYVSGPYGELYYNTIRDCNNLIVICEEYGINAVYSLINRIITDNLNINLTVFYNVKKYEDIIFLEELNNYNNNSKIDIEIILSEEIVEGYKSGYVTSDLIKKKIEKDSSIFIYAKEGMLKFLNRELEELKLPRRYIRYESYLPRCNIKNAKKFDLNIKYNNVDMKHFCFNNKTLLESIEDSRAIIESISRTGKENLCNIKLLSGKVKIVNDTRNDSEKVLNLLDPANTYPNSNISIEIY